MLTSFLTLPRKKEKQPNSDKIQSQKAACTLLSQIITHSSPDNASNHLSLIGELIYTSIKLISKSSEPLMTMKRFIDKNKGNRGRDLFKISTPTLKTYTDSIRPAISDEFLHHQVERLSQKSAKLGVNRKENSLAIDPTTKEYHGKYPNQCQPKGYVGQKERYPTAYSEQAICDCTNQYILSSQPKMKYNTRYKSTDLPAWLHNICAEIDLNFEQNKYPKVIYGDREYYQALGFAYATLNWMNPLISINESPRLVVPKKMFDKNTSKLDFLLDPNSKQINMEYINLGYYQWVLLGNALNQFPSNKKNTKYKIPVAIIATFDAYSNRRKKKNLDFAKQKAQEFQNQLLKTEKELKQAIEIYDRFVKTQPREYKGKKTNFGGRGRSVFKNANEKSLYDHCRRWWKQRTRIKKKIRNLSKRLMFFLVSVRPNEDVQANSEELIQLSRGYHQRWMIENAFKSIKGQFWIPTKKRSLQARHTYFIISALMYNAWHYQRLARFKRKSKYSAQEVRAIKSWKKTENKKMMQELIRIESARAFLMDTFRFGLKSLLKRQILA